MYGKEFFSVFIITNPHVTHLLQHQETMPGLHGDSRRAVPSTLNSPTTVHIDATVSLSDSKAEALVSQFITVSEHNNNPITQQEQNQSTGFAADKESSAKLSQLKRIQRSLRGLPPLLSDKMATSSSAAEIEDGAKKKKIVFDE
ncbi:uncharacterized protein LODBEIA_P57430 [Lodderomyces beijingensis]|uniref:Uncharacterized protein n=1 Tax=Lodderomyces beijingensis TaxID=1775926 RepID=A0ABP0ZNG0_9ASCO